MSPAKLFAGLVLLVGFLVAGGCQSAKETPVRVPSGVDPSEIAAIHVISVPVGLNLDGKLGLDGISLKVYANDWKNPKPVSIQSGRLEIQMFDGTLKTNSVPIQVWAYEAAKLKPFEFQARIGTGYEFTFTWGEVKPKSRTVAVRAIYNAPSGRILRSAPSSITVQDMPAR